MHYLIGWLVAVAIALVILVAPFSLTSRVVRSLVAGPLCGMAVHLYSPTSA